MYRITKDMKAQAMYIAKLAEMKALLKTKF